MAQISVRHILVQHRYEAEDLKRLLARGESFENLARKFSLCPSAKVGGDLGAIDANRLESEFAEVAQQLQPGEISAVVRTRFGYHLILRY